MRAWISLIRSIRNTSPVGSAVNYTANFDPRKFLKEATNAMSDICAARFEAFGSAGNADKIKVSSLDTMSQRYLSGELDAIISEL
jgi:fructose-bisphosphate aldolase class II